MVATPAGRQRENGGVSVACLLRQEDLILYECFVKACGALHRPHQQKNREKPAMNHNILRMASALIAILVFSSVALAAGNDVADGKRYFLSYCASCHGVSGDGHGPVAPALSKPPANLRLLAEKYGMPLPAARLASLIDGRSEIRAHGSREMPVWGEKLYQLGEGGRGDIGVSEVIGKIVAYLNTIQDRRTAAR